MYWRILCLLCILLTACSDLQRPEQLDRIEKLEFQLESARQKLTSISDSILLSVHKFAGDLQIKLEVYSPDTVDLESAMRLDRYCRAGESSLFVLDERLKLLWMMPEYIEDVRKLKQDIETGSGQRHRYDEFLRFEEDKMKEFMDRVALCMEQSAEVIDVNDELRAVLEAEMNERMSETRVQIHNEE